MRLIDIVNNLKEQFAFNQDIGLRRDATAVLTPDVLVTITLNGHGFIDDDMVFIKGLDPVVFGDTFNVDKMYTITVIDQDNFTIELAL